VAGRWTMRGTDSQDFNRIPATGKIVTLTRFDLLRLQGDRAELWHLEDNVAMLQQLGVMPGGPA
jgi:hypothetical protein